MVYTMTSKNTINNTKSLTHILEYVTWQADASRVISGGYEEALIELINFCEGHSFWDEKEMKKQGYLQDDK